MTKISAVIITFNEEKMIGKCLESIKGIADEILVVDSFSTDKTKDICQLFGAKFIENKFEGHIQQKNYAAQQAKYDMVLSLDADEVLSDELKGSISLVKSQLSSQGYYVNRLNNYCGKWIKHGGWYPDKKLRLWDRRKGQWDGVNPHDRFEMEAGSKINSLQGDLLHYTFFTTDQHVNQAIKFANIGASAAYNKGRKSSIVKIILYPFWKFIRDYFFRAGFLDGYYGFVIASISAHSTFIKYVKIREIRKNS